jgi:hypothetical protein
LDFFQKVQKVLNFSENSSANFQKFQIWVCSFKVGLLKHVHAKFRLSSFHPDGLRNFVDIFLRKFQNFSEKLQIWVCSMMLQIAKHVHVKCQLSSFYPDGFGQIIDHFQVNFRFFLRKFQNFPIPISKVPKTAS